MENFRINDFRQPNESFSIWKLRRRFLLVHKDKFSTDRLICLTNCFINVKCHGCKYSLPVMTELKHLIEEVMSAANDEMEIEEKTKPNNNAGSPKKRLHTSSSISAFNDIVIKKQKLHNDNLILTDTEIHQPSLAQEKCNNPKSTSHIGITHQDNTSFETCDHVLLALTKTMLSLPSQNNDIQLLYMAADKCCLKIQDVYSLKPQDQLHCCDIFINNMHISSGSGSSKKNAKHVACNSAVELLRKLHVSNQLIDQESHKLANFDNIVEQPINDKEFLLSCNSASQSHTLILSSSSVKGQMSTNELLAKEIVIFKPSVDTAGVNAKSILYQTAAFNKVNVKYEIKSTKETNQSITQCKIFLDDQLLIYIECTGTQTDIKNFTAEKALQLLHQFCWTIQAKSVQEHGGSDISRDELMGQLVKEVGCCLDDSNVGKKLMLKMGWKGGGIGADSSGITEPIAVEGVINRQGLGLGADTRTMSKDFVSKVRNLLQNFITSNDKYEMKFSPEFQKEEREVIHREARKLHLKSSSHGKNETRFLVITRRKTANELFHYIMQNGGETTRFLLKPPLAYQFDDLNDI